MLILVEIYFCDENDNHLSHIYNKLRKYNKFVQHCGYIVLLYVCVCILEIKK